MQLSDGGDSSAAAPITRRPHRRRRCSTGQRIGLRRGCRRGCGCRHAVQRRISIFVERHCASIRLIAFASRRSMVSPRLRRTSSVRAANQHQLASGSHSAASLPDFRCWLTVGDASVRFRRSVANRRLAAGPAKHSPLSWASPLDTMCSMSVWERFAKSLLRLRASSPRTSRLALGLVSASSLGSAGVRLTVWPRNGLADCAHPSRVGRQAITSYCLQPRSPPARRRGRC